MASARPKQKKKTSPHLPRRGKNGVLRGLAQSLRSVHRLDVPRLTPPSRQARCVALSRCGDRRGWLSPRGAFCGVAPSLCCRIPPPSRFVAIRGVLAGFCGDVATPSRTPSPAPSQTCVSPSPSAQMHPVHVVSHVHRVVLHVPHPVGHPKSHTCAPIGTLYRYILSQI